MKQNHHAEAEADAKRVIAWLERILGRDHSEVLFPVRVRAHSLGELGRLDEAEPVYRRALALAEKVMGPATPTVAEILDGLSWLLSETGREAEADEAAARARSIREKEVLKKLPPPPELTTPRNEFLRARRLDYERRFPEAPAMRLPRVRFTVRRMMIAVAVVAVLIEGEFTRRRIVEYRDRANWTVTVSTIALI
jgi:hypothetical protein